MLGYRKTQRLASSQPLGNFYPTDPGTRNPQPQLRPPLNVKYSLL